MHSNQKHPPTILPAIGIVLILSFILSCSAKTPPTPAVLPSPSEPSALEQPVLPAPPIQQEPIPAPPAERQAKAESQSPQRIVLRGKSATPSALTARVSEPILFVNDDGLLYRISCYESFPDGSTAFLSSGKRLTAKGDTDQFVFGTPGEFKCLEVVRGTWIAITVPAPNAATGFVSLSTPAAEPAFSVVAILLIVILLLIVRKFWRQ